MRFTQTGLLAAVVLLALVVNAAMSQKNADKAEKPVPAAQAKRFELRVIRVGNTFQSMRFNAVTGESWIMSVDKYEKVPEPARIPAGEYEVTLITDGTNWMAFRIDKLSGSTWQLRGNRWIKVKEPDEKPE